MNEQSGFKLTSDDESEWEWEKYNEPGAKVPMRYRAMVWKRSSNDDIDKEKVQ